jgi:DNA-directed RNA polymerase alpha subunit
MKIEFLKSPCGLGLGYFEGDQAEVKESLAKELINTGFAKLVPDANKLPDDCPSREILEANGIQSVEALKKLTIEDLTAVNGIGKKSAEKILEYVK